MGQRLREDFCMVRPTEGHGRAIYTAGTLHVDCTRETPQEVTRGEWECILKPLGVFELAETEEEE